MSKPSIPQGTRDFGPEVVRKRQFMLQTLQAIFEQYGYQPIETPSMEHLQTLMGKYGDEGDRLIFKILNNGLHETAKHEKTRKALEQVLEGKNDIQLTERALRYDLTIPFARFVVMNQNDLNFPFKRYQMQPVWRADRPQKGRYREFWQCDCDVVGSKSLLNEAELIAIYRTAFQQFNIPNIKIRINSRKVLAGLAAFCDASDLLTTITVAIDKLDKIGIEGVTTELKTKGLNDAQVEDLSRLCFNENGNLETLKQAFVEKNITIGIEGIQEIESTLSIHNQLSNDTWINSEVVVDFTLARGLNYYTGIIIEVICNDPKISIGSIGGGGRYDDLTGLFGLKNMTGVGVSFGVDRIYDVMETLSLFPPTLSQSTQVMLVNTGGANEQFAIQVLKQLRMNGIKAELYPDAIKFDKQMKYIFNRSIPFAVIIEDSEREGNFVRVKSFEKNAQQKMTVSELIESLKH
jgi:histidyl-tRNA synthetase